MTSVLLALIGTLVPLATLFIRREDDPPVQVDQEPSHAHPCT